MFPPRSPINGKTSKRKECTVCEQDSAVDELKARVAVRYLIKKSKRFDALLGSSRPTNERRVLDISRRQPAPPECLVYLGLTPRSRERTRGDRRDVRRKRENRKDDFQFPKPTVYECDYCAKILFHRLVYRRHMIRHIKRHQRCARCSQSFRTKIARRRHQLTCRR